MRTINGINYVMDKPAKSDGSCVGCVADGNHAVCSRLNGECVRSPFVWQAENEELERTRFEDACVLKFATWREAGNTSNDNGADATRESLCWRTADGEYGVHALNAAWWGWKTAISQDR